MTKLQQVENIGPTWDAGTAEAARATLDELLRDHDRFVIVGIRRTPSTPGGTSVTSYVARRGSRTSALEMLGAIHSKLHDWMASL